ncbi:hypothetical protein CIW53_16730 [Rhodanobacter sp. T12-5]|nr:hypothetical protein CIW53_16730 [Rhodanobacter sp. T12-5]
MGSFRLKADRIEIVQALLQNGFPGVTVTVDDMGAHRQKLGTYQTKSVPTFDDASSILQVIVHIGEGVAIKVFADWFTALLKKYRSEKSEIDGTQLPNSDAEIKTIVNAAANSSVNVIVNVHQGSPKQDK